MRLAVVVVLGILWIAGSSVMSLNSGQVLQVDCPEPRGCFGLLEKALATAPAGSVIRVGPGVFYEQPLVIDKSLSLQGAGADRTKIRMVEPGAAIAIRSVEALEVMIASLAIVVPFLWNVGRDPSVGVEWVQQSDKTQTIVMKDSEILSFQGVLINSRKGSFTIQQSRLESVAESISIKTQGEIAVAVEDSSLKGPLTTPWIPDLSWLGILVSSAISFITDDSPGRVYIALKNNQIHFWHIGFSAFSLGHKGWSRADALLIGNTITFNKGPGVLLGGDTIAELKENIISDNDDYGVTLFLPPCASISSGEITAFRGRMYGKDNVITNNKRGDLCPPDYPWPSGFRK